MTGSLLLCFSLPWSQEISLLGIRVCLRNIRTGVLLVTKYELGNNHLVCGLFSFFEGGGCLIVRLFCLFAFVSVWQFLLLRDEKNYRKT